MPLSQINSLLSGRVLLLPTEDIDPNPNQPRRQFDRNALEELSLSIRQHGVLQPLTVRREGHRYELIAGERRLRAARMAQLSRVPCLLMQVNEEDSSLLALVENIQRRDLDYMEEAAALSHLIEAYGLSQDEAARKVGKSQSAVANKLRLLRLSPEIVSLLMEHNLSERHARALLRLPDNERRLSALAYITARDLNVAQTDTYIDSLLKEPTPPLRKPSYILKDVRLFLNTITHSMDLMRGAGVNAVYQREDRENDILLTISIPRTAASH